MVRSAGRLRVLHVMGRMAPAGTEHQLAGMLEVAHGRRWDATLCVLRPDENVLTRRIAAAGVPIVQPSVEGTHPLLVAAGLRELARRGGFDVVHPSLWGASAVARACVGGRRRPAVVMSERRVEHFRAGHRRLLDRALRRRTDGWIGNSEDVVAFIRQAHGAAVDRVRLVPNGIDRGVFYPVSKPRPRAGRRLRIGAVGRLVHQKGFDVLIDALPCVLAEHDVEVEIAGQGELRDVLITRAAGLPVTFIGLLDEPKRVGDFLRSLDLFVMPSRYEGRPNAAIEAAACGLDIVATDAPGMRAALGSLATVSPDNPRALAETIVIALRDGVAAPVAEVPDFEQVADAHLGAFEAALSRRRKG